ncbi:MAG: hypothetical protein AABY13_04935 [Nanoarchaeota archaeon]
MTSNTTERQHYLIAGAILGCLKGDPQKNKFAWDLEVTENLKGSPWIAVVRTNVALSAAKLREFFDQYTLDPDGSGVPYYFLVKDVETDEIMVLFTDEYVLYPLNTREQRMRAYELGIKKGLIDEQVDFVHHEAKPNEFAF